MGNENSPEHSPNRLSRPRRILTNTKTNINKEKPVFEKPQIIQNLSKWSRIVSKPKNIMNFIAQTENIILLKNMNDSLSIGLNHLNILIENDLNNPFLENQIKYLQIVDDSIDKKILAKLNYQSKEYNQKQMDIFTNNLIEINNNNFGNNINIGNISSIHKRNTKYGSREDSPTSREDELDLTSFSTTIGGKVSSVSNCNNSKNQNSKQLRTFKIRKKDGFYLEGNCNNNVNNNHNNKNSSSRQDSPNSTHSINSTDNISNILSSINGTNIHSKNSSNTSIKEKILNINNSKNNNTNNSNNNKNIIIIEDDSNYPYIHKKKNTNIISINNINQVKNVNKTNKTDNNNIDNNNIILNNKIILKKVFKKKLISQQKQFSVTQDNVITPRKTNTNINLLKTDNNNSNNQNNFNTIENNNYIKDTSCKNNNKKIKHGFIIPNVNFEKDNNRKKSPNFILNNKILNNNTEEQESENSQVIFNNIRIMTQGNNYSYSNNNSSMINNNSSITQNKKVNNTNIINEDKIIKYLNDISSSNIKTEPSKDNNSSFQGVIKKTKIIKNDKNKNTIKNENNSINKVEANNSKIYQTKYYK